MKTFYRILLLFIGIQIFSFSVSYAQVDSLRVTNFVIDDDGFGGSSGDDDGLIERGESIELILGVTNYGSNSADNVEVVISTSNTHIVITDMDVTVSTIFSNNTSDFVDFDFLVKNTAIDEDVTFQVNITSDQGNFTDDFTLHITGPPAVINAGSFTISDDNQGNSSGNGDGIADAGETIELNLYFKNIGGQDAVNCQASLSSNHPGLNFITSNQFIGSLSPGDSVLAPTFLFSLDEFAQGGMAQIDFQVTGNTGAWSANFELDVKGGPTNLELLNFEIDDDAFGGSNGNDNDTLEAGETVEVPITLVNTGGSEAINPYAILRSTDPDITLVDTVMILPKIQAKDTLTSTVDFDFIINPKTIDKTTQFTLIFGASNLEWDTSLSFSIFGAPSFAYGPIIFDDDNLGGSQGNSNGLPEAGETLEINIPFSNQGGEAATNILALLSSNSPFVEILDSSFHVPALQPDDSLSGFILRFRILPNAPTDSLEFNYTFQTDQGEFLHPFKIGVQAQPNIQLASHVIDDDDAGSSVGNGNGQVEGGESIEIFLEVANLGGEDANGLTVVLRSLDSLITMSDTSKFVSVLDAGDSLLIPSDYDFNVDPTIQTKTAKFLVKASSTQGVWYDTLEVSVTGIPNMVISNFTLDDDMNPPSSGDNSGSAEAGETISSNLFLKNTGSNLATGVYVKLVSNSPFVQVLVDSMFIGSVGPGVTSYSPGFLYKIDSVAPDLVNPLSLEVYSDNHTWIRTPPLNISGKILLEFDSLSIDDDAFGGSSGNGNGIPEAGESVEIVLTVANRNGGTATNVEMIMRSLSSDIVMTDSVKNIGTLGGNSLKTVSSDLDFDIASSVVDSLYPFQLEFNSDQGSFIDTFYIHIQGFPNLFVSGSVLDDDNLGGTQGNNNDTLDAGELAGLSLAVQNAGGKASTNTYVLISTLEDDVSFNTDSLFIGSIPSGGLVLQSGLVLSAGLDIESGDLELDLVFVSDQGTWSQSIDLPVQGEPSLSYLSHFLDDDKFGSSFGNGDSIAQAGEVVELLIYLLNDGGADALNVEVEIESLSPYLHITDSLKSIAEIDRNGAHYISSDYDFFLDANAPTDSAGIAISMRTTQETWLDTFYIQVEGRPLFTLEPSQSFDAMFLGTLGDGDSIPEAGETVFHQVKLTNIGGISSNNAYLKISSSDSAVSVLQDSVYVGKIDTNAVDSSFGFLFRISGNAVDQEVNFQVEVFTDHSQQSESLSLDIFGIPELKYYSHWFDDDPFSGSSGDGDSIPEAGETIEFLLTIENAGGGRATNLLVTVSTPDSLIQFTDSTKYLSAINRGKITPIASDYDFIVDPFHPSETVTFYFNFESDQGNWTDSVQVFISGQPNLLPSSFSISDDNIGASQGDGNGIAKAGEIIELNLNLANIGLEPATNAYVIISPRDSLLQPLVDSVFLGTALAQDTFFLPGFVISIDEFVESDDKKIDITMVSNQATFQETIELNVQGKIILAYAGYQIDDDVSGASKGDSDGAFEAGEKIELRVEIGNTGGGTARNMEISATSLDTNLNILDSLIDFHVIGSFDSVLFPKAFLFELRPDAPSDTATIYLNITEDQGVFIDSFQLAYAGNAVLDAQNIYVMDDNLGNTLGDHDSVADYSETIALSVDFANLGIKQANQVYARLSTTDSMITMVEDSVFIDSVAIGQAGNFRGFLFEVDSSMTYRDVDFVLEFFGNEGAWVHPFDLRMNGKVVLEYVGHTISDDPFSGSSGDGDGIPEGGESIELYVQLANLGVGRAQDLTLTLRSNDPEVVVTDSVITTSNVFSMDTTQTGLDFDFDLADTIQEKDVFFDLKVESKEGTWNFNFPFRVYQGVYSIDFIEAVFSDDTTDQSYGDNDGKIEAGESIEYRINWANNGTVTLRNVVFAVETDDPDIIMLDTSFTMSSFSAGDTSFVFSDLEFDVKPGAPTKSVFFRATVTADNFQTSLIIPVQIYQAFEIKVVVNPPQAGVIQGAGFLQLLDTVTLKAQTHQNFKFLNWMELGRIVSRDTFLTFIVGSSGTLVANFTQTNIGLEEETPVSAFIYPNPVAEVMNIRFSEIPDGEVEMALYDLNGRLVWKESQESALEISSHLPNIPPGTYVLNLGYNDTRVQVKLVIGQ